MVNSFSAYNLYIRHSQTLSQYLRQNTLIVSAIHGAVYFSSQTALLSSRQLVSKPKAIVFDKNCMHTEQNLYNISVSVRQKCLIAEVGFKYGSFKIISIFRILFKSVHGLVLVFVISLLLDSSILASNRLGSIFFI